VRFLSDENFPFESVTRLREAGHDVVSIQQSHPGLSDLEVLKLGKKNEQVLLTFDRDFGDLIFNHKQETPLGIVYFRFAPLLPSEPADLLLRLMKELDLDGNLTVLSRRSLRQRPLPK
jgi:predicted nuclease of predicted toxin-antitoxin system